MIKTLKGTEAQALWWMMGLYAQHMLRHSKRTLLSWICGLYGVQMVDVVRPGEDDISHQLVPAWTGAVVDDFEHLFVVMHAVFPAKGAAFITERFDLKGSTVGRECGAAERAAKGSLAVLKDLDLLQEVADDRRRRPHADRGRRP